MAACNTQLPKSLNNDTPKYVQFVNCTGRMVYLFWLDYAGDLVRYGHIPPRRGMSMNTFVTHPWIARDATTWYPLLLNGKQIFHPEAERGEQLFHDENRDRVVIHIPVYPLFRRCLEVVYLYFQREAIAWANIPKNIKDVLFKMARPAEFDDYADFDMVIYDHLNENENDLHDDRINNVEANANNGNRDEIGDGVENDIIADRNEDVGGAAGNERNEDVEDNDDFFYDVENDDASDRSLESDNENFHDALEKKER